MSTAQVDAFNIERTVSTMQGRTRRQVRGPRTDGAEALDIYLRTRGISINAFCATHGLSRLIAQRVIGGDAKWVTVDFAFAIQEATRGKIKAHLFRTLGRFDARTLARTDTKKATCQ